MAKKRRRKAVKEEVVRMTYGAERLAHYIAAYDLSQQQMGERLGCTQDMVNRLIKGKRRPSLALAVRVEQQTEIPTSAWL